MSFTQTSGGSGADLDLVLDELRTLGKKVKKENGQWMAQCPAHDDRTPSLSIKAGNLRGVVFHCHAGCSQDQVMDALGWESLFPKRPREILTAPSVATRNTPQLCNDEACASMVKGQNLGACVGRYRYTDATGALVGEVHRYDPKSFRPFTMQEGKLKPGGIIGESYRLPECLKALEAGGIVYIVEGEKDADSINALRLPGIAATTNSGGAGKWRTAHTSALFVGDHFTAKHFRIIRDLDEPGKEHALKVVETFGELGMTDTPGVLVSKRGKDLTDHLEAGFTLENLTPDSPGGFVSSWSPIALDEWLDGTREPFVPTILTRSDGVSLFYPGETSSGKSLIAQYTAALELNKGNRVLYIDAESNPGRIIDRLQAVGASVGAIRAGLVLINPTEALTAAESRLAFQKVLEDKFTLAVVDAITGIEWLVNDGKGTPQSDAEDIFTKLSRPIATRTGAAVIHIDHTPKNTDKGKFAIGSQHKIAGLSGAAYTVEMHDQCAPGVRGSIVLRIGKDRPGEIMRHCPGKRRADGTTEAAYIVIDSTHSGTIAVEVRAPEDISERPSKHLESIPQLLRENGAMSKTKIEQSTTGNSAEIRQAIEVLAAQGIVEIKPGANRSKMVELIPEQATAKPLDEPTPYLER